jgi:uncharacterized membrane protein
VLLFGDREHTVAAWIALPGFATLLLVAGLALRLREPESSKEAALGLVFALASFPAFLIAFAATSNVSNGHGALFGVALLAPTAVYLLLAAAIERRRPDPGLQAAMLAAGLGLIAIASAAILGGSSLAFVFAIEAMLAASVGLRARDPRFVLASAAYLTLAYCHLLLFDAPPDSLAGFNDAVARTAWVAFAIAGAALMLGVVYERLGLPQAGPPSIRTFLLGSQSSPPKSSLLSVRREFDLLAATTALWGACVYSLSIGVEITNGTDDARFAAGHVLVTLLLVVTGVATYLLVRTPVWRLYGQVLLAVAGLKAVVIETDYSRESWQWLASLAILGAGVVSAGALDATLRRGPNAWLPVNASDLIASALIGVALALLVPEQWPSGPGTWEWLVIEASVLTMLAGAFLLQRNRDMLTVAWAAAAVMLLIAQENALGPGHHLALALTLALCGAVLLAAAMALRDPRLSLGSVVYAAFLTVVTFTDVAPPSDLLTRTSSPAAGVPAVLAVAALTGAYALTRPLRFRLDGDALDRALFRLDSETLRATRWFSAATVLYAIGLVVLGIAQTLPGAVDTNFQRGQAVVSGLWAIVGFGLLYTGLFRGSRSLRIGALVILGVSVAKLFVFDLGQLSSLARAFSFMSVGIVLLGAGLIYARLSSDLQRREGPQDARLS